MTTIYWDDLAIDLLNEDAEGWGYVFEPCTSNHWDDPCSGSHNPEKDYEGAVVDLAARLLAGYEAGTVRLAQDLNKVIAVVDEIPTSGAPDAAATSEIEGIPLTAEAAWQEYCEALPSSLVPAGEVPLGATAKIGRWRMVTGRGGDDNLVVLETERQDGSDPRSHYYPVDADIEVLGVVLSRTTPDHVCQIHVEEPF